MRFRTLMMAAVVVAVLTGCSKQDGLSDGNGPGDADGLGGRTDSLPQSTEDPGGNSAQPDPGSSPDPQNEAGTAPPPAP